MNSGYVTEIFSSIQGEGLFTGERQIFVRLAGCPLRCDYCDTPGSLTAEGKPRMSVEDVLEEVKKLAWSQNVHSVSITGGEPLAQSEFLQELLPSLKENEFSIHLETAGIHYEALEKIVQYCDVIAMDIKLPSALKHSYWIEHKKFLEIGGDKIFVKVVLEKHTQLVEINQTIDLLSQFPKPPFLFLQIVTPQGLDIQPPDQHEINGYLQAAKEKLPHVMVSIQKHKEWAIR